MQTLGSGLRRCQIISPVCVYSSKRAFTFLMLIQTWSETKPFSCSARKLELDTTKELVGLAAYRDMPEGVLVYVEYMESAPSGNPTLSKPRKYAGIGAALLAFGIQLSIDYGYGGAIYLKAKTSQLREHYMRNYGAIPFSRFDPFLLLIDGDAARELFGQYLKEV